MGVQNLKISVSGVRGVIGETLTPSLLTRFASAFATYVGGGRIVVGRDSRTSGDMVWHAVASGLLASGSEVIYLDIVPIPVVEVMVRYHRASGGIGITASHNPGQWNALKFFRPDGIYLTAQQGEELLDIYHQGTFRFASSIKDIKPVIHDDSGIDIHHSLIMANIDVEKIKNAAFRVAADTVNGAASVATPLFLSRLGVKAKVINSNPNGLFPHPPEPRPENLRKLSNIMKKGSYDVGFAQDPDADRLALLDEKGAPISEEYTLALAVYHLMKNRGLRSPVVVNLSTSRVIDDIASMFRVPVFRSKVGEVNVVEKMFDVGAVVGGEGNGGVIWSKVNPGRDSFVGMALILELIAYEGKPLSEIVARLPHYEMVKDKVEVPSYKVTAIISSIKEKYAEDSTLEKMETFDGVKLSFKDKSWVHVRPSNTEPIIRVIAEAPTVEKAKDLVERFKEEISAF